MKTALLLSGGMDSVSIAYWKRPNYAITIDYGQKPAAGELRAAEAVCRSLDIEHVLIQADISKLGSGDLAGSEPSGHAPASEWWPYRNQFLITLAAMKCHNLTASTLMVGALKTDGFHSDGSEAFITQMNNLVTMQEGDLNIEAPAIGYTASELVRAAGVPIEILAWSHSCHLTEYACGFCRGCRKHYETMEDVFGTAY